ncbi:MAG: hypothetical protein U1F98_17265 [Verrucomicrobiota bacterium]
MNYALRLAMVVSTFCFAGSVSGQITATASDRSAPVHPCGFWSSGDVREYKASLARSSELKNVLKDLQAWGDKRISESLDVPAHGLDTNGTWTFPGFARGYQDVSGNWQWEWKFNGKLQQRTADVSSLGMLYALTGDGKYAAFAKQLLVALADAYAKGGADEKGHDHFEAYGFDGGDAGMFLAKACHGYDLIFNAVPSADRAYIERDLIRPMAEHLSEAGYMYTGHARWGMVCLYGVFIAGVTLNDPALVEPTLYGRGGTRDHVTGGFMDCFKQACLRDGVIWGADTKMEEQMAAVCVLTTVAEVMRHHGLDLYAHQDRALKKSYDASVAAVNGDVSKLLPLPGVDAFPYAFLRYQESKYLPVVSRLKPGFTFAISERLPPPGAGGGNSQ